MLFHSPEEQTLAQAELGFNCPGARCLGTFLASQVPGDAERGRGITGTGRRYLVYCGRYVAEKGLLVLLDYAARYATDHPDRFAFVFTGRGSLSIPKTTWATDLGFVDEARLGDVLAGAAALVQPSRMESLSLAALEAWHQAVPVLADSGCEVMTGHFQRGGGGRSISSYTAFAQALDDLWQQPQKWKRMGEQGQRYVRNYYGSRSDFTAILERAIRDLRTPLTRRMIRCGLEQAATHARPCWRERFAALVDDLVDSCGRPYRRHVSVRPRIPSRDVQAGKDGVLVPVRVTNHGTHALVAEGPAATMVQSQVTHDGLAATMFGQPTRLPGLLRPGQSVAMGVPVPVPVSSGDYCVTFHAVPNGRESNDATPAPLDDSGVHCHGPAGEGESLALHVSTDPDRYSSALLDAVQSTLVDAHRLQRLPDTYLDVSSGLFARWKRWLKRKLLGNFQRAYVDVLSRQQTAFNQRVLTALVELVDCCATQHSAENWQGSLASHAPLQDDSPNFRKLLGELAESRRRTAEVEERLARLEALNQEMAVRSSTES
jgi:hypothetical protein